MPAQQPKETRVLSEKQNDNTRSVFMVPARVRPCRSEPEADDTDVGQDKPGYLGLAPIDDSLVDSRFDDDPLLGRAYTSILDGNRSRRTLASDLDISPNLASNLINQLKGKKLINNKGVPFETQAIQHE